MLNLHYNGSNSLPVVNTTKMYQFKVTGSEVKQYPLCLGNIWKEFKISNMKKQG